MKKENLKTLVSLREGKLNPKDESFIYNSWLKSHRSSPECKFLDNDTYYNNHKLIIQKILSREGTNIILACNPEDEDQIYGWLVEETYQLPSSSSTRVIHYIYVKYNFRRMGIGRMLFEKNPTPPMEPIPCTHQSHLWSVLKSKTNNQIFYDLYIR